ncbi:MAG: HAMP domain-containing sensor histidine kinase, partial [Pseudomonadota bacterium]
LFPAAEDLPPGELRIRRGGGLSLMALAHEPTDGERVIAVYNVPDEVLSRPGGAMDRMFELLQFGGRIGLAVVLFWAVLTIFVVRRIYLRTRRMSRWTQALTAEHEREDPRFGYREFDDVGRELNQAFARISAALEREREFVRNASHELRTPLTIIQANVALAQEQAVSGEPLARVERAATRMQKLVETLLWLSREESASQAPEPVDLHELLEQLIEEHRYLLRGRQVSILDQCQQSSVTLAPEPARIALGNLLRNAFEHSSDDDAIEVSVDGGSVMIRNRVADDAGGAQPGAGSDGLGLTLVRRVTDRMGWDFYVSTGPAQHCVRLSFGAFG